MDYKIEKNVPVPPQKRRGEKLELIKNASNGDSLVVETRGDVTMFHQLAKKIYGCKIVTRKVPEGGFRVWILKEK